MKNKKRLIIISVIVLVGFLIAHFYVDYRYDLTLSEFLIYSEPIKARDRSLMTQQPIIFGVFDYPPLSYTNQYNNLNSGIIVDYIAQIAIEFGHDIVLKVGDQNGLQNSLQAGEIDALAIEKKAFNAAEKLCSKPLLSVKGIILVSESSGLVKLSDLKGQSLVAIKRHRVNDIIDRQRFEAFDISIVEVDNMYQCFALLKNGSVAGYLGDDMEALHYLNVTNKGSFYRFFDETYYVKEIVFAVNLEKSYLVDVLNKAILSLKKKNLLVQTQYKWLGDFEAEGVDPRQLELIYKMILGVIIIIGVFSFWNYLITKKVNDKTQELVESRAELRLIIDTMHSGILVFDDNAIILDCNNLIANMLNMTREQLLTMPCNKIIGLAPFIDSANHNRLIRVANAYYYTNAVEIANNKKMLIVEDYTEKYLKERRARQQSKMIAIGQLSAGLAHEIRNPLGLIKSYSYVIEKGGAQDQKKHALQVINESVSRINALIDNLLRYSKLTSEINKVVDIAELIDMIITLEKKNLEQNEIVLLLDIALKTPTLIVVNEDLLKLIFINLINNSIDSFQNVKRARKQIEINVRLLQSNLVFTFKDNGCGIDGEALENIFNPFYSTKENGTGLGLYILNTEVSNADGSISVKSELDVGTEFEVILPISESEKKDD